MATSAKRSRPPPDQPAPPSVKQFTVHEAKTNLSRLMNDALAGHTVIIARGNKPLVRLEPIDPVRPRIFGALKGQIALDDSFFDPLPDDELKAWGER